MEEIDETSATTRVSWVAGGGRAVADAGPRTEWRYQRRVASLFRRAGEHAVFAARSNQQGHGEEPAGRLDLEVRQLRHAGRDRDNRDHADHGERRALFHGGSAPLGGGGKRRHRGDALDLATR